MDFVRVGYFIPLNGPLNGHPPSKILYPDNGIIYRDIVWRSDTLGLYVIHQFLFKCNLTPLSGLTHRFHPLYRSWMTIVNGAHSFLSYSVVTTWPERVILGQYMWTVHKLGAFCPLLFEVSREAPWSSGRTLALDAARPRSVPVGGENY